MNPPAEDIKDILVTAAVGTFAATTGWGIFISQEPTGTEGAGPDTAITIYDTPGSPADTLNNIRVDDFSVQVRVRGAKNDYTAAWAKMEAIVAALNQQRNVITGSTRYASIYRAGTAQFIKRDDQNRPIFTCNFAGLRTTE